MNQLQHSDHSQWARGGWVFFVCALLIGIAAFDQAWSTEATKTTNLVVRVSDIASDAGFINVAVYCSESKWLKHDGWVTAARVVASAGSRVVIKDVPLALCAVSLFHDVNGNNELDRTIVPTEPYGFSQDPAIYFGPPSFQDCVFEVQPDQEISVRLR